MNKQEAQALVGKPVIVWTALWGTYQGILIEIVTEKGKPWRGRVEIADLLEAPFGHRLQEGQVVEVGHSSIKAVSETTKAPARPASGSGGDDE